MNSEREAHLLDRVRETAKRCISAGVRLDLVAYEAKTRIETDFAFDFLKACEEALFQLAELSGVGEMYTEEDVEEYVDEAYDKGFRHGHDEGYDDGYKEGYENAVADQHNGAE